MLLLHYNICAWNHKTANNWTVVFTCFLHVCVLTLWVYSFNRQFSFFFFFSLCALTFTTEFKMAKNQFSINKKNKNQNHWIMLSSKGIFWQFLVWLKSLWSYELCFQWKANCNEHIFFFSNKLFCKLTHAPIHKNRISPNRIRNYGKNWNHNSEEQLKFKLNYDFLIKLNWKVVRMWNENEENVWTMKSESSPSSSSPSSSTFLLDITHLYFPVVCNFH